MQVCYAVRYILCKNLYVIHIIQNRWCCSKKKQTNKKKTRVVNMQVSGSADTWCAVNLK